MKAFCYCISICDVVCSAEMCVARAILLVECSG
jgi:hypothetical protein